MSMIATYNNIIRRNSDNSGSVIKDASFTVMEDCTNSYDAVRLPTIPAGTVLIADFAGDFGMYAMAEVKGVLHKVKIELHDLHKIDFGSFDARSKEERTRDRLTDAAVDTIVSEIVDGLKEAVRPVPFVDLLMTSVITSIYESLIISADEKTQNRVLRRLIDSQEYKDFQSTLEATTSDIGTLIESEIQAQLKQD